MTMPQAGAPRASTDADLIRAELAALGLSQREAARKLQIDERAMRYYCAGREPVPRAVMLALRQLRADAAPPRAIPTILDPQVVARLVPQIRSRFAPWFSVADGAHRIAVEVLPQLKPPQTDNTRLLAALLFGRILTSFQSAYMLTERGHCGDARTVLRAMVESAIFLGALVTDPLLIDRLVDRHVVNERKLVGAWLADPVAVEATSPENLERLREKLAENRANNPDLKRDPIDVQELARSSDLLWLYNTAFRVLSGDAAHTSVLALERHVKTNAAGDIIGLQFGPNASEVPDTLSIALPALLNATHTVISFFGLTKYKPDLDKALAAWQALSAPDVG
jgi:hypothetical protein